MISLNEARSMIAATVAPLASVQESLEDVHGRVLREDVAASEDVPAFDRSAMDGYAIARDDPSARFAVVGEVRPGEEPRFTLQPGECARVFTGSKIPTGASQVIMQEEVVREGEWIVAQQRNGPAHIRVRGEDARAGDALLRAGTRLRAPEMALLAQLGVVRPWVSPAPQVIHLVTGGELVPPANAPGPGQIRDSNSTLVASLLREAGARLVHQENCGDDVAAMLRGLDAVPADGWDLLLISGGASVGDYDFGERALAAAGFEVRFRKINLRPGKPLIFATCERKIAFVIPGNPVSHFVTFHVAIRSALELLAGGDPAWPLASIVLEGTLPGKMDARETYWPVHLLISAGELRVQPLAWQSSGDLCGLKSANALVQISAGEEAPRAGSAVKCLLLDHR